MENSKENTHFYIRAQKIKQDGIRAELKITICFRKKLKPPKEGVSVPKRKTLSL